LQFPLSSRPFVGLLPFCKPISRVCRPICVQLYGIADQLFRVFVDLYSYNRRFPSIAPEHWRCLAQLLWDFRHCWRADHLSNLKPLGAAAASLPAPNFSSSRHADTSWHGMVVALPN
jgi:hypothetical protein